VFRVLSDDGLSRPGEEVEMTKLAGIVVGLGALFVVGAALAASTDTYSYRATLGPKAEVPPPNAPAKAAGVFSATVTEKKGKASIRWTLTFRRLSGKAMAAHIHMGKAGVAGPVVVPLCGPCKTGQNGRQTIDEDLAEALEKGGYYVNVHTDKNKGGEIRGQLKLVGG
jgi:CHRD domain